MNGHRARQIRHLAWEAHTEAAVRTGDHRFLTGDKLRGTYRKIKRYYQRHGTFPASVDPASPAARRSAFGGRR